MAAAVQPDYTQEDAELAEVGDPDKSSKSFKLSELINPTPRQREFLKALLKYTFTLYGGARGGGKSYILRWVAVYLLLRWAAQGHKGVRVGIFCETFPELKERQLGRAVRGRPEERYPAWLGTWNLTEHEFRLRECFGAGVVAFRNLDDPKKYLSAEFAAILIDELTRNPQGILTSLQGSLRWPGIDHTPFAGATNPGGIGHAWVKDLFVDQTFELEENKALIEPDDVTQLPPFTRQDFHYIKALSTDNPHNSRQYRRMLDALTPRLRAAYRDGNWDVFEGQAFDEWDREVHVKPNAISHLKGWRWVAAMDWGFRKGVMLLAAIGPEGDIEVVHEVVFSKINADDAGYLIPKRWDKLGLRPDIIIYDEQMDQDTSHAQKGNTTLAEQFFSGLKRHYGTLKVEGVDTYQGPPMVAGAHAPGSRKVKYDLTHKYLKFKRDAEGNVPPWFRPRLTFQSRCKYCVRTIPALQVDPDQPEDDVDKKSPDDHGYDALGFILTARVFEDLDDDEPAESKDPDRHPGFDRKTRGRKPAATDMPDEPVEAPEIYSPGWEMPRLETLVELED